MKFLVIHGPNLNLLGRREVDIYGNMTLDELNNRIHGYAKERNVALEAMQTNKEDVIIDQIQNAENEYDGVVLNPGGYTHTSVAIRDAIAASRIPVVEVHLSNIFAREEFRSRSVVSSVCYGLISGFGAFSYMLGIESLILKLKG